MMKFRVTHIDGAMEAFSPLFEGRHPQLGLKVEAPDCTADVLVNLDDARWYGHTGLHAEGFLSRDCTLAGMTFRQETDVVIDAVGGRGTLTIY